MSSGVWLLISVYFFVVEGHQGWRDDDENSEKQLLIKQHKQTMAMCDSIWLCGSAAQRNNICSECNKCLFSISLCLPLSKHKHCVCMRVRVYGVQKVFHLLDSIISTPCWLWKIVVYTFTRLYVNRSTIMTCTQRKRKEVRSAVLYNTP